MSDRGYQALGLEMEAKAIEIRVKGWEASNSQHPDDQPYDESHFYNAEKEMLILAQKVRDLA